MSRVTVKQIRRDSATDASSWRELWQRSPGATVFHHPDFLAYHRSRFQEHHVGFFKGEVLIGVIPTALVEEAGGVKAASPYGASYGGLISPTPTEYSVAKAAVAGLVEHLRDAGARKIVVTPAISAYYPSGYSQTFLFAMIEHGFKIVNSDITSLVPLTRGLYDQVLKSRARNTARKAESCGIVCSLKADVEDFWPLMELTFARHGTAPTHSYEEWRWLMEKLPDQVWVDVAYAEGKPVAGIGHFRISDSTDSSFYLCSDPAYKETHALTLLICRALLAAQESGFSWFDFGTSSSDMVGRENIFRFKEGFGAIGLLRQTLSATL